MSTRAPPQNPGFEVTLDPAPKAEVIDAAEDHEDAAKRAAALASTYDPNLAHAGKTDEELIAEREAQTRALIDVAIGVGVVLAIAESVTPDTSLADEVENNDLETEGPPPTDMQDGE